jgi:putative ABC transport system substrate-binding protein
MQCGRLKRREFFSLLGASAAWPVVARAQQAAMPVVGYLGTGSSDEWRDRLRGLRQGMAETGYVEGQNVAIEFRWAEGQNDRLPGMAADLVRRHVTVIVADGAPSVVAAKAANTTIPIVFFTAGDPVRIGLVASLNRPSGNVTGVSVMNVELTAKLFGLLHELLPGAAHFAVLINPTSLLAEAVITELKSAAVAVGHQLETIAASTSLEIEAAFATLVQKRADALLVAPDGFFVSHRVQLAMLAVHHRTPVIYSAAEYVKAGGLMSYGPNIPDMYRQAGIYAGRVLKGEKPADLPVLQPSKFEFLINLQAARMIGLEMPTTLLARADEVIE